MTIKTDRELDIFMESLYEYELLTWKRELAGYKRMFPTVSKLDKDLEQRRKEIVDTFKEIVKKLLDYTKQEYFAITANPSIYTEKTEIRFYIDKIESDYQSLTYEQALKLIHRADLNKFLYKAIAKLYY